jgi:hypothetical protein
MWSCQSVVTFVLTIATLFQVATAVSLRQCQHAEASSPHIANRTQVLEACALQQKNKVTYMPSNTSIYYDAGVSQRTKPSKDISVFFPLCLYDVHRDARYCKDFAVPAQKRQRLMIHCLQAFTEFAKEHNLPYWLIHGGLIGWYFNEHILPWDMDIDIQVLYHDLAHMYRPYHNTVYRGRYRFEINPNSVYRLPQITDVIDARFIDQASGLYIDVTGLSYDAEKQGLHCKTPHYYKVDQLFPLQRGNFSGAEVWLPNQPLAILEEEYPRYRDTEFHRGKRLFEVKYGENVYLFNEVSQKWVRRIS